MPTYVVTGAARGIGLEFVKQLLKAGHVVIATTRTATPSTGISKLVSENDDRLIVLKCNLSSADSVKQFGLELEKRSSSVDVLINNAGISTSTPDENVYNLQPESILEQINVNVIGTLLVTQAVAPLFHPGTKVLNISSMGSSFDITLRLPIPSVPGYSISKAALNMLSVKQSFFYHDCIVTAVDPGLVKTDMNENGLVSTDICVKAILQMEAKLALNDTGKFLSWKGETLNW